MAPKQSRSQIWHHFTSDKNGVAACNYCAALLKCGDNYSTSSLVRHLRNKHQKIAIHSISDVSNDEFPHKDKIKKKLEVHSFLESCTNGKTACDSRVQNEDESLMECQLEYLDAQDLPKWANVEVSAAGPSSCGPGQNQKYSRVRPAQRQETVYENHMKQLNQKLSYLAQRQDDENETTLFFLSMIKIVKKLPLHVQASLRRDIGNMIGNAEVTFYNNKAKEMSSSFPANDNVQIKENPSHMEERTPQEQHLLHIEEIETNVKLPC